MQIHENHKYWMISKDFIGTALYVGIVVCVIGLAFMFFSEPGFLKEQIFPRLDKIECRMENLEAKIITLDTSHKKTLWQRIMHKKQ